MGFENKYPYTDFHELNLDWVLEQISILRNEENTNAEAIDDLHGDLNTLNGALNALRNIALLCYDVLTETDLNEVRNNGCYLLATDYTYTNLPANHGNTGFLRVVHNGRYVIQTLINFDGPEEFKRRGAYDGSYWEPWQISAGNVFLQATGDNTDRSTEILRLLNLYGYCKLGEGNFVVNNVILPDDTCIEGSGYKTNIIVSDDGSYAFRLGNQCNVSNMRITGKASGSYNPSSTIGTRHGIEWHGTGTSGPYFGFLNNVWIRNFNGVGLYVTDTGNATYCDMLATNVYIENCDAGILTSNSEYHRFSQFKVFNCYYGCINRGGNNFFESCDFTSCKKGFVIDNYAGNYANIGHGSIVNCTFNHIGNNTGNAIDMEGNDYGFIISGCTFFYSHIHLLNCKGVTFTGCNFGGTSATNIDVSHDSVMPRGLTLFTGCAFQNVPYFVGTDADLHGASCYTFDGNALNF